MKKPYPKSTGGVFKLCAVLLIVSVAIIYGCRKDISKMGENTSATVADPKIAKAKSWYENSFPKQVKKSGQATNAVGDDFDLSQFFSPNWADAKNYTRFNDDVIEMPMDAASVIGLKVKAIPQSSSRSSVLILKRGDTYKAYVMTIVGYPEYLNGDTTKLANNSYAKHDANFSGMVYYTTPEGEFVSGYTYKNGVLKGQLMDEANTPTRQTTQSIKNNTIQIVEVCTEWFQRVPNDEGGGYHWVWIGESDCHNEVIETPDPANPTAPPNPGSGSPGDPPAPKDPECPEQMISTIKNGKVINTLKVMLRPPGDGGFPPPVPPDTPCPIKEVIDTAKIVRKFCDDLTTAQKETIMNTLMEFKNYNCLTTYLYNAIASGTTGYSFCITPGMYNATYSSANKSISFATDYSSTRSDLLGHEMFHGFQDMYYPGGIAAYGKNAATGVALPGFTNIEFEQAVFSDIVYNSRLAFQTGTDPQKVDYENWLNTITNSFTSYPQLTVGTAAYNDFITKYNGFLAQYSTNPDNPYKGTTISLDPSALINLFKQSNCH
jgi:hypothetical protein